MQGLPFTRPQQTNAGNELAYKWQGEIDTGHTNAEVS